MREHIDKRMAMVWHENIEHYYISEKYFRNGNAKSNKEHKIHLSFDVFFTIFFSSKRKGKKR